MKKIILRRAALGAPIGLAVSYLVTVAVSLGWGGGDYLPCMPELVALAGSESGAVALQAAAACFVGAGFAGSSAVWEMERWSLARQTGVYFLLLSLFMLPAAWAMHWMRHSPAGAALYFGVFALLFALFWAAGLLAGRRSVRRLNARITERRREAPAQTQP